MRWTGGTRHSRHHVNQITPITIHYNVLRPIRKKLCENWHHRTANALSAELEENYLIVKPVKSGTVIDLHNPGLLPTLQYAPWSLRHEEIFITNAGTFPMGELGGWNHPSLFHKPSKIDLGQMNKHLHKRTKYLTGTRKYGKRARGNMPKVFVPPTVPVPSIKSKVPIGAHPNSSLLTSLDLNALGSKTGTQIGRGWQFYRMTGLLIMKIIWQ